MRIRGGCQQKMTNFLKFPQKSVYFPILRGILYLAPHYNQFVLGGLHGMSKYAKLTDEQLKKIQALEQETGVVMIAYEK